MKIICIGRNYVDHAKELNNPIPSSPLVFMKPATALVKGHRPFYHPEWTDEIHYECEVVLRISKPGKSIPLNQALEYVDKFTLGLDYTARDIQTQCKSKGHPWEIAKAFDYSAPIGEFQDFELWKDKSIEFRLEKNGVTVQNGNTKDLIFSFEFLIFYVSKYFTLKPGDLIFTGTPAGVGQIEKGDIFEGFLKDQKILLSIIK
jgi:2-keto-4-pentenoate hydratase/2-oxohepta-3-ene-1,7-dioic acid hydratase in catechol pathway